MKKLVTSSQQRPFAMQRDKRDQSQQSCGYARNTKHGEFSHYVRLIATFDECCAVANLLLYQDRNDVFEEKICQVIQKPVGQRVFKLRAAVREKFLFPSKLGVDNWTTARKNAHI